MAGRATLLPYLALLQVGFSRPPRCRDAGALLPHHFTLTRRSGRYVSVALSVGSRRPGVTWHLYPMESGLSSTRRQRLPGPLNHAHSILKLPDGVCVGILFST